MSLNYTFEPMSNGSYQVRLCGEFVCYSNHRKEQDIDLFLKQEGYETRKEFFDACMEDIEENF
jgi:hypothetical protein